MATSSRCTVWHVVEPTEFGGAGTRPIMAGWLLHVSSFSRYVRHPRSRMCPDRRRDRLGPCLRRRRLAPLPTGRSGWRCGASGVAADVECRPSPLPAPAHDLEGLSMTVITGTPWDLALNQSAHRAPNNVTAPVNSSRDRKSTRLNSSHVAISYAVF